MYRQAPRRNGDRVPTPAKSLFHGLQPNDKPGEDCLKSSTNSTENPHRLPGHPQTRLTRHDLRAFLTENFCTPKLDRFSPWLWLVATQKSDHIKSMTHQVVRGREITVTESPELHLVWHDKRMFIKPLPPFLLSKVFWEVYFNITPRYNAQTNLEDDETDGALKAHRRTREEDEEIRRALLGFMRSYRHLIEHPSDFALAVQKGLIPVDCNHGKGTGDTNTAETIDYTSFIGFMEDFDVCDKDVSPRFRYGDLRLSRLNFWAKFVLWEFTFEKAYGNYDAYFSRFYGPLLFLFGVLSIIISSIQLGFTSQTGLGTVHNAWRPLYKVGEGFSVAVLVVICVIAASLLALFVFMGLRETIFALCDLIRKRFKRGERLKSVEDGEKRGLQYRS
ncbi:hypothetical protein HDK77DRAFT_231998 [Phyllosticta capitalensis]